MAFISASGTGSAAPITASAASRALPALAALLLIPAPLQARHQASSARASLDVEITGLRSNRGLLRLCLTADVKAYPDCKKGKGISRTITADTRRLRFDDLAPGRYALAVIHDENSNAKLDTALGIPREGFGFSNNPGIGFGAPSFEGVSFEIGTTPARHQVKMRYLL